jgi:hypothetical protein
MKNHVYKILEIVGSSETSIEEAIGTAIARRIRLLETWIGSKSSKLVDTSSTASLVITKLQSRLGSLWKPNYSSKGSELLEPIRAN